MNSTNTALTPVSSNTVDIFGRLPIDCSREIASLVPVEIASLNKEAKRIVDTAFDDLRALYVRSAEIRPFMPSLADQNTPGSEIVKQTVANIFLFGTITGQQNFSKNLRVSNLQSILSFATTMERDNRERVVVQICESEHLQMVHTQIVCALLAGGPIENWHRGYALVNAANNGHLEIVQALLANGPIRDERRGDAVMNAANKGHLEIVRELLTNGPIGDECRGDAVRNAATNGHLEIVQALLASGPIGDERRGDAVVNAVTNGHLEIVRALLANGPIEDRFRDYAVVNAAANGHLEIVQALLANGPIRDERRGSAVVINAAANSHLEIVQALLANGPIEVRHRDTQ
jgi:hypothetical protein